MYKTIILFTLLLTSCSNTVYEAISPAKYSGIKPQKGDNLIIVMSDLSSEALYKKIAQGLSRKGYDIENSNEKTLIINSGWKTFAQKVRLKINASIYEFQQGSIARINGLWMNADQQNGLKMQNEGIAIEYSENNRPWNGLHNFATAIFDLEQITYE